jgi:hypothetical protein
MITLFLSHAYEDQEYFVRPLAEALKSDFKVWYSEYELTLGDPLLKKIEEGLHSCDYGIVVLSQHFFAKRWPRAELDGLFGLETTERKVILPIWKGVSEEEVRDFSPILAGYLGISTDQGMARVVNEIKRAVALVDRYKGLQDAAWKEKFASLNADVKHRKAAVALAQTIDGVQQVTRAARDIIVEARRRSEMLAEQLDAFQLKISDDPRLANSDRMFGAGVGRLSVIISFEAGALDSVDQCAFHVCFFRERDSSRDGELIEQYDFLPKFDRQLRVYWQSSDKILSTGEALLDLVFERFVELLKSELNG